MKWRLITFRTLFILISILFSNQSSAGELIKGLTIDCYPQNDLYTTGNKNLNHIVLKVNQLHKAGEYGRVLGLLISSIDTTANEYDKNRLKYLYLFKLNQYGRWLDEISELIAIAENINKVSNDTIRLYYSYYLLKFDLKQLHYPVRFFIRDKNLVSLEQTFSELIKEANNLKLFELKTQLTRLMNSKDILRPGLYDVLSWDCKTEIDSFRIGRLGYISLVVLVRILIQPLI